jgi:hypothetical protein
VTALGLLKVAAPSISSALTVRVYGDYRCNTNHRDTHGNNQQIPATMQTRLWARVHSVRARQPVRSSPYANTLAYAAPKAATMETVGHRSLKSSITTSCVGLVGS